MCLSSSCIAVANGSRLATVLSLLEQKHTCLFQVWLPKRKLRLGACTAVPPVALRKSSGI